MSASVRKVLDLVWGHSDIASSVGVRTDETKSSGSRLSASNRLKTFQPLPFLTFFDSDSVITSSSCLSLRVSDIFSMSKSSSESGSRYKVSSNQ